MLRCCSTVKEDLTGRKYCIVLYSELDNSFVAFLGKHLIVFLKNKFSLEQIKKIYKLLHLPVKLFLRVLKVGSCSPHSIAIGASLAPSVRFGQFIGLPLKLRTIKVL